MVLAIPLATKTVLKVCQKVVTFQKDANSGVECFHDELLEGVDERNWAIICRICRVISLVEQGDGAGTPFLRHVS